MQPKADPAPPAARSRPFGCLLTWRYSNELFAALRCARSTNARHAREVAAAQFPASLFLRADSNSSPGCHAAISGCDAALAPSAKPKRAILAKPAKSISARYSSLG